ncbi:C25 family cysteine peptidase [Algoriphagus litoralis]|uniref:C25 family cysteine peptidase n=1 Tax=Algoriphagus litoralis TaxID=2202829 RepID=UPI000DBA17A5|nr:C25 family cysteine peptidase [Algoriphagus litoralis]
MNSETQKRGLIIPFMWMDQADEGIARLNSIQPCYFLVGFKQPEEPRLIQEAMNLLEEDCSGLATMMILPRSFAQSSHISFWPKLIQAKPQNAWICALFFADTWEEVEHYLQNEPSKNESADVHVSCQYQPPYTDMLELWAQAGAKPYHPGDYFKEDFLQELKKMSGIWAYWGHSEGDRIRGYGHVTVDELLSNSPEKQLLLSLWFTCSTLDPEVEQTIGLAWFLSGKTQSLLASPFKVKTEENQLLGRQFLNSLAQKRHESLAEIILDLISTEDQSVSQVLNQYHLLGNPWVDLKNINLGES